MSKLTERISKLEAERGPGKIYVFTQSLENPDLYTDPEGKQFTQDEIRAAHPGDEDIILWVNYAKDTP